MESGPGAAVLSSLNAVVADLYAGAKAASEKVAARVRNEAAIGLTDLIHESYSRRSLVKTLAGPDTPIPLRKIYVPADLKYGAEVISETTFLKRLETLNRVVVMGTAGAGKSLLLKSIFLHVLDHWSEPIPIFIELRDVNEIVDSSDLIMSLVLRTLNGHVRSFTRAQLDQALYSGKFAVFLDALDEVNPEKRATVLKEIAALSERNRKTKIVLTSRYDEIFATWEEFSVFRMQPLSQSAAKALVQKLPFDPVIKAKFEKDILEEEFSQHAEFLTVPLLLVIMLIVYHEWAEIPTKIVSFYNRAFDALFGRHDATKEGFRRKLRSDLSREDFKKVFTYFSAATYRSGVQSISRQNALAIIGLSIEAADVQATADHVFDDMVRGVCLLQEDGLHWVFAHRSFQEYFAALSLVQVRWSIERRIAFVDAHGWRLSRDNVTAMMAEIDRVNLVESWVLPAARSAQTYMSSGERPDHVDPSLWQAVRLVGAVEWDLGDDQGLEFLSVNTVPADRISRWLAHAAQVLDMDFQLGDLDDLIGLADPGDEIYVDQTFGSGAPQRHGHDGVTYLVSPRDLMNDASGKLERLFSGRGRSISLTELLENLIAQAESAARDAKAREDAIFGD